MKKRITTALFAIFLGVWGVHRFYLKQPGLGILYLFTFGLFTIGCWVDFIVFLTMSDEDFDTKYNPSFAPKQQKNLRNAVTTQVAVELKKLHELKELGIITNEEFGMQKGKLLQ